METKTQIIRVEGKVDSYGIGEQIIEGVVLFKSGDYGLSKEELNKRLGRAQ